MAAPSEDNTTPVKLFPTVPNADALGPAVVRYSRPAAPLVQPDLSFDYLHDLVTQVGDIRTDRVAMVIGFEQLKVSRALRVRARIEASIAQKCLATLVVQRGWHLAFSRGYGIDYERALKRASFGLVRADLENQFVAQLTRIVGVAGVGNFVWRRDGERAYVRMQVRLSAGGAFGLQTVVPPPTSAAPPVTVVRAGALSA